MIVRQELLEREKIHALIGYHLAKVFKMRTFLVKTSFILEQVWDGIMIG